MRKKNSFRHLAIILGLSLLLSAFGCGNASVSVPNELDNTATKTPDEKTAEPVAPTSTPTAMPVETPVSHASQIKQLTGVTYPETVPQPKEEDYEDWEKYYSDYQLWRQDKSSRNYTLSSEAFSHYLSSSVKAFMNNAGDNNLVYSPLNVYMALAMLSEVTDSNSRAQILDALGFESMEALRDYSKKLWLTHYSDDGVYTSILASSLWLSDSVSYKQAALDLLAENYYSETFSGTMGSQAYNDRLHQWINEKTHDLLKDEAEKINMDPSTVLGIATTIYFKAPWTQEFNASQTEKRYFTNADGTKTYFDFMKETEEQSLYFGKNFTAACKSMKDAGKMWFILPNEGCTASDLLGMDELTSFLLNPYETKSQKYMLTKYVPKFDVKSDISLIDGFKSMGITDVLSAGTSDFSPLTDLTSLAVDEAKHAARVKIDEEGCEAAAFTVILIKNTAVSEPPLPRDFILDRPFIFAITDNNNIPSFIGIVNTVK